MHKQNSIYSLACGDAHIGYRIIFSAVEFILNDPDIIRKAECCVHCEGWNF